MHTSKPAIKRILGGGFALATAAAFIAPGVAAGDSVGADSVSSLTDSIGEDGSVSLSSLTDSIGDDDADAASLLASLSDLGDLSDCDFSNLSGDVEINDPSEIGTLFQSLGDVSGLLSCVMSAS